MVTLTGATAALVLSAFTVAVTAIVLSMPKWLFGPLVIQHIRRVRDDFVDAIIRGELPKDDIGVRHTRQRFEFAIIDVPRVSAMSFLAFVRATRRRPVLLNPTTHLRAVRSEDREVAEKVRKFEDRMALAAGIHTVVGTWSGMLIGVYLAVESLFRYRKPGIVKTVLRRKVSQYLDALHEDDHVLVG